MRNVSDKICRENQNTHFIFNNLFFFENRVVYKMMWKNILEPGRPQIKWRMRISHWVPNATNTPTVYNAYCFSTETMIAKRASILRYVYFACLVVQ
jgi:hypothetical protein